MTTDLRDYKGMYQRNKSGFVPAVIQIVGIITLLYFIKPTHWYAFGAIVAVFVFAFTVIWTWYHKQKLRWDKLGLATIKTFIYAVGFYFLWYYVGAYSIWLVIIAIAGYKMWKGRALVKDVIKSGASLLEEVWPNKNSGGKKDGSVSIK